MMPKVYIAIDEGDLLPSILLKNGCEVDIGDGNYSLNGLEKYEILVPGKMLIDENALKAMPHLKMISKIGVGVERIDISACTKSGVIVANTPRENIISVAEHTMALILGVAKQIAPMTLHLHRENPDSNAKNLYPSFELANKTLSIIGYGSIGRRVAQLASAFEMHIVVFDPFLKDKPNNVQCTDSLDEALALADIVTLHVAGNEANSKMINSHTLSCMKPAAYLVNTTRGLVIDEEALVEALQTHKIAGAALDVFQDEPLQAGNPLCNLENVLITPHSAANTPEARIRMEKCCAQNILDFLQGKSVSYALNKLESKSLD